MDFSNYEPDYDKIKRRSDYEFERAWLAETTAKILAERKQDIQELTGLKQAQEQRAEMSMKQRHVRYQKLKGLKEMQEAIEKGDIEQINKLRKILYLLKNWSKEKLTIEPIPDKPGYVKLTITAPTDDEIEWDESKLGPRPKPTTD